MDIVIFIEEFGFPIFAAVGLLYLIYYVWKFITLQIKVKLGRANTTLIALIDRIRMLDNDLIRLQQKLDTVIELREQKEYEDSNKKPDNNKNTDADNISSDVGC